MKPEKLWEIMEARHVARYHTEPSMLQPLGEHMHGVALLCHLMTTGTDLEPLVTVQLLLYALTHDKGEKRYGDMPYMAKNWNPNLAAQHGFAEDTELARLGFDYDLTPAQVKLVKICDMLELCFFARRQWLTGNQYAKEVLIRGLSAVVKHGGGPSQFGNRVDEVLGLLAANTGVKITQLRGSPRAELMED